MDVLAQDDDALVGLHAPVHRGRDRVDEGHLVPRPRMREWILCREAFQFRRVASDAAVHGGRVGPELGADPPAARVLWVVLDQCGHGIRHRRQGLVTNGLRLLCAEQRQRRHLPRDSGDRVALPPGSLLVLRPVAERAAGIRTVLMEVAVHLRFDDARALPGSEPRERLLGREVHGQRIHAVHTPARDAETLPADGEARVGRHFVRARGHGVQVVLDEVQNGQLPGGREIHRLQHRADLACAVAEVVDRDVGGAGVLLRPGVAGGDRSAAADDGVRAEGSRLEPLQVHRAPASARESLGEAEDLGEGPLQERLKLGGDEGGEIQRAARHMRDRLREELMVPAVRPVDGIR